MKFLSLEKSWYFIVVYNKIKYLLQKSLWGSRDGTVVRALTFHWVRLARVQFPDSTGVEFVVDSRPCSERVFTGTTVFPIRQKPTFPDSNSIWMSDS